MLRQLLEVLVLPPASALVLFGAGLLLRLRRRGLGRLLCALAIAWLWLASTPFFGGLLLSSLQRRKRRARCPRRRTCFDHWEEPRRLRRFCPAARTLL